MADLALDWGDDLVIGSDGDLLLVEGVDESNQRIQRRLFTATYGYVWHSEYGAGLPQKIGRVATAGNIQSLVTSQILLEQTVASVPVPSISVDQDETVYGLYNITINYVAADTGKPQQVSVAVPKL